MDNLKSVKCSNCRQEIERSNHMMHELSCARINTFCDECNQVYENTEREQHLLSHKKIEPLKSNELGRKESNKMDCPFCGLILSQSENNEHVSQCEARSNKCEFCQVKMLNKDLPKHLETCQVKLLTENSNAGDYYEEGKILFLNIYRRYK